MESNKYIRSKTEREHSALLINTILHYTHTTILTLKHPLAANVGFATCICDKSRRLDINSTRLATGWMLLHSAQLLKLQAPQATCRCQPSVC